MFLSRDEREKMCEEVRVIENEIPPPRLLLPISSGPATVGGAGAGAFTGAVLYVLLTSQTAMNGLTGHGILFWFVVGGIAGGVFRGVESFIYNVILKNSSAIKSLKVRYPEAAALGPDELVMHWFDVRAARLWKHAQDTFQPKEPGITEKK